MAEEAAVPEAAAPQAEDVGEVASYLVDDGLRGGSSLGEPGGVVDAGEVSRVGDRDDFEAVCVGAEPGDDQREGRSRCRRRR
ncbi:hypothetical protein [Streptomyces sp. CA-132043]|uniref:hypothetical protein n=1 Tax=Streptomyces sp. CA-132043 TaxID=3240048 RepID=UPI003D9499C5